MAWQPLCHKEEDSALLLIVETGEEEGGKPARAPHGAGMRKAWFIGLWKGEDSVLHQITWIRNYGSLDKDVSEHGRRWRWVGHIDLRRKEEILGWERRSKILRQLR